MQSCELVTFVTAVACTMSQCYSEDELAVIAAVFTQLGDTLTTILAQEQLCSDDKASNKSTAPLT
ncbi:hypothetical protein acsn021_35460 [Anaerocolumna cellulosilytica]|uniref:Uncharacterized protein n=1 Tax=Anaerocolumna cellulosilytica TaxID=433286 RepID=A0A6S6R7H0_9FIRM|nr:DUF6774 domain-containing protein [Anaerocolumna cellulosilytica]MBB5195445.1 hypothetical protein [Anaerocolumna cellulosilytica]BCJ95977.1 hypothetical protein acsn021_35460 [Anaerocolumna cellulosilytica]